METHVQQLTLVISQMEEKYTMESNEFKSTISSLKGEIKALQDSIMNARIVEDKGNTGELDMNLVRENFRLEMQALSTDRSSLKDEITRLIEKKISLLKEIETLREKNVPPSGDKKKIIQLTPLKLSDTAKEKDDDAPVSPGAQKSFFGGSSKGKKKDKRNASTDELNSSGSAPQSSPAYLADIRKLKKSGKLCN